MLNMGELEWIMHNEKEEGEGVSLREECGRSSGMEECR